MKRFKKTLKTIISLLISLAFVLCIYIITMKIMNKVPKLFGYSVMHIVTGSMEPAISTGDYILIKSIAPEDVKKGDVICFYSRDDQIKGMPNTHRVVDVTRADGKINFQTKGDANAIADKIKVQGEDVIGVYIKKIKVLSVFAFLNKNPLIFLLIIVIPAVIFFISELVNVARVSNSVKENENEDSK